MSLTKRIVVRDAERGLPPLKVPWVSKRSSPGMLAGKNRETDLEAVEENLLSS
ncbi:hypothetical protein H072_1772 [Dactylellina haptotyla CBS 200.50]|uniref:Uncharacterized protein n=1 Tax=Dactylellina haptotyla (strain CBS 200.50) TaxID=1284197 RepID=S8C978_DACHA|nr:hypothetical protein H072_1772 [Dactylellina haptotyla CBS 200.50]